MKTKKWLGIAAGGVALLSIGAWQLSIKDDPKSKTMALSATSERPAAAEALRFTFVSGTTYVYGLHYASKTKAMPMAGMPGAEDGGRSQTIEGNLELDGRLLVHAYRPSKDDGQVLGLRLEDCKGNLHIGTQPAWPEGRCAEVFTGKEEYIHVDPRGVVTSIFAAEGGASLFDYTMRALIEELQVRLAENPGTTAWVEAEPLPQGNVESLYRLVGEDDAQKVTLERSRQRYLSLSAAQMMDVSTLSQDVSAKHRIVIQNGVLSHIDGKETLEAKQGERPFLTSITELAVEHTESRVEERELPNLAHFTKRALEDLPQSKSLHARILEQRAAGLFWEDALHTMRAYGDAGPVPDHNRFLWRVTALLELEPKRAFDLIATFEEGKPGGRLRGMVLDLLASVSTPEAQKVMRQLLSGEKGKTDPKYVHLVQRMGFVSSPEKESISFVKERFADATRAKNKNERFATAYALGSLADRAKADGDEKTAKAIVDDLILEIRHASPEELLHLLNALANTDHVGAIDTFGSYAKHPNADVREAVADALDEPQTPRALALLLELAGDPSRAVQRSALKSLRHYQLTAPVMLELASLANGARFLPENVRFLLDLVKTYRFVLPNEMNALLRGVLANPVDDPLVHAAAQTLLDASR